MVKNARDSEELFMEELKEEFKESVAVNVVKMAECLDSNDLGEIARIAHDIKGTSGLFGFNEGTDIARDLQYAAQNKEVEKTRALYYRLVAYMKENEVIP